ncbi:MAG: ATP-dependent DNA helicase, partial [Ignavibacteria bacterium]|nr:ATP-dependent DNA helicase [Ignavibacteria bacterium]
SAQLNKLYDWSKRTKDGTLSDIDFEVSHEVWDTVCSERGICTKKTCGGEKTKCFFQKARMELEKCDVIILNHHLFFTLYDGVIEDKSGYLYSNDLVIFDEAHTVEQVAADHISPAVSRDAIRYNLLRLYNSKKKRGFLLELPSLHLQMQVQNLLELNQYFFHRLRRELFHADSGKLNGLAVRIYEKDFTDNELGPELMSLIESLRELRPACATDSQTNELNEFITRFSEIRSALDSFITQKENTGDNEFVYWAELGSARPESNLKLCSSPVDLSGYFRTNIFKNDNSAILTSATLTTGNSFDYFNKRLGAEAAGKLILDSPFDYSRQVRLYIPKDIPPPVNDSDEVYLDSLKEWIMYFVDMTGGKALVLFTNRSLLRRVGEDLKQSFAERSIDLLMQGESRSRKMLLDRFRSDVRSVLFGLDSFWMGIDVPGESLSNLIIIKLPFQVPSHPLVQARIEFIEKNGGNSFIEYSLPEAVLKFRQGIGRLIRNSNDKGIIAILDNRVITKPYGKTFLNSIEDCPMEIIGSDDIPVTFRQ